MTDSYFFLGCSNYYNCQGEIQEKQNRPYRDEVGDWIQQEQDFHSGVCSRPV